ncbi:hypothetical protein UFOVP23_8 [uncultured Caudovirales phage]|uniref:Uncharacterized protein n=1 Tax=uncultured Caudovirales phage TaxID=2100421 RepID=A0A6J5T9B2_9CAUD|nr:hypothetical protein UFOVP23_8 [uncultured Caudovirales phage]
MSNELAKTNEIAKLEEVMLNGDLNSLTGQQRLQYYKAVCDSLSLNSLTQPFAYIRLNGKLTLYARKDCTDQLRSVKNISISIKSRERIDDVYMVVAQASTPDGRSDESLGAVTLAGLSGASLADAYMKCETKAKRRATLSLIGLGLTDESEILHRNDAQEVNVDAATGEIIESEVVDCLADRAFAPTLEALFKSDDRLTALDMWKGLSKDEKKSCWAALSPAGQMWIKDVAEKGPK